jgi:hypothetical protein
MPSIFDNPIVWTQCQCAIYELDAFVRLLDLAIADGQPEEAHVLAQRVSVLARVIVRATAAAEPKP